MDTPTSDNTAAVSAQSTYYVSTTGQDAAGRDGLSSATAWKSLAYACERVPEGSATIQLGEGTFVATKTAVLKSGFTVVGKGASKTTLTNAASFTASADDYCKWDNQATNYLISVPGKQKNITIKDLLFTSPDENALYGAIYVWDSDIIEIKDVTIRNFSWSGLYLNRSKQINVQGCFFEDASYEKHCNHWGGGMRTRYVEDVEVARCEFKTTKGGGYGYHGEGHVNAKIHDNTFHNRVDLSSTSNRPFDIESAHELEWGLEIYNNVFNGIVSVPKAGGQKHPSDRGYTYTVRIHDNVFYGSGGVEGPRSYLEIDRNYFAQKWNNAGRAYEIHGGENAGPTKIHHNVAECSMGFVFKKGERNENMSIFNNTVYLVNSARHNFPTSFLEVGGEVKNWQVKNNVVFSTDAVSPDKPSVFSRGSLPATGMDISNNVAWKVGNIASGAQEADPQLALSGAKPEAYYAAAGAESYVVDRGVVVGFPFEGTAPDLGAYEWKPTSNDPETQPNVVIRARGTTGEEKIVLRYNDQRVGDTIDLVTSYQEYKVQVNNANGNFKVAFVNDNGPRTVLVDWLQVGTTKREAESRATNTGAHGNGRCGGGTLTERMACNGYIDFGTMSQAGPAGEVVIRAKGATGSERMSLLVDNEILQSWTVATAPDNYTYPGYTGGVIQVSFDNDLVTKTEDRNLAVDYIRVCGTTYESNGEGVVRKGCGTDNDQGFAWLHCLGSFTFGEVGCNPAARTADRSKTVAIPKTLGEQSAFRAYPNPASGQLTVEAVDSEDYRLTLYDMGGRIILHNEQLANKVQLDISHLRPGLYLVRLYDAQQEIRQRIVVE